MKKKKKLKYTSFESFKNSIKLFHESIKVYIIQSLQNGIKLIIYLQVIN